MGLNAPVLQLSEQGGQLADLQITSHSPLHFELLFLLVELSADDILVNSIYYEVLQFSNGRDFKIRKEAAVCENLLSVRKGFLWSGTTKCHPALSRHGSQGEILELSDLRWI